MLEPAEKRQRREALKEAIDHLQGALAALALLGPMLEEEKRVFVARMRGGIEAHVLWLEKQGKQ